jgi:hypothetical protein
LGGLGEKERTAIEKGERRDSKERERLNLESFILNAVGKLCYMIMLVMQH